MMAKSHLRDPSDAARTRCGLPVVSPAWAGGELPVADDASDATCRICLRRMLAAIESGEEVAPYTSPGPQAATYGARALSTTAYRAIAASRRERTPAARQWPSPEAAVRSYVRHRAEGASLRSTSDPDRAGVRVQSSRDPSLGGREHLAVERHRTVAVALDRAAADVAALEHACPVLTPDQCRYVYLMRVTGEPISVPLRSGNQELKSRVLEWRGRTHEHAAERASEAYGAQVTERHVTLIVRHFSGVVRDALLASGEMGGLRRDEPRQWDPLARLREAE